MCLSHGFLYFVLSILLPPTTVETTLGLLSHFVKLLQQKMLTIAEKVKFVDMVKRETLSSCQVELWHP